jgi:hypothetical protein
MNETIKGRLPKPTLHGFLFGNGALLTPDEMKTAERYGFLFNNGMILTPEETKIMENIRVIHAATI